MTRRIQEELPGLLALARDRSEASRIQLASRLADLFLGEAFELSEREESLLNELIDDLLKTKNVEVRQTLARKFAEATHMPRTMAVSIAHNAIDIARPVLIASETLTDADLIEVVESGTRDHAAAIAMRRSISEAVADALITTGDVRVMQMIAENLGAKLTTRALNALAEVSRVTTDMQRAVMHRPEMSSDIAIKLYWWVEQDLRRYALQRFGINAGQLDLALSQAIEQALRDHLLERHDDTAMQKVADWLDERRAITPRLLPQILRLGHFRLFHVVLSRITHLGLPLVDVIVSAAGGRFLAALCRAIGIDKAAFVSIFLLSRGARADEHIVHPRELSFALAAFDRLSSDMASELIVSWRANPDYLLKFEENEVALEA